MRLLVSITLVITIWGGRAYAMCKTNSECPFNQVCVKGGVSDYGTCERTKATADQPEAPSTIGSKAGLSCSSNWQCGTGGRCNKPSDWSLTGICTN